ncbi:ribonucleotide reductase of class Ia (aerobic), alpha subunit [Pseudomonas phage D6]|nr:ribonucleotide reductase of class Ia (aerobic), alpha subunit [Pseudomonas phage D6]
MIKNIIKLDGTIEKFSPAKANGWGEWAAAERVDWAPIVLDAAAGLGETVTSQEFQSALIEQCLNRKDYSHFLMAGRLYAVLLRKKIYGTAGIPTVKALQTQMRKDNVMIKLDYSTAEYKQIEKMINHDLDLDMMHFSLHHIRRKYALQNRVTGKEYETAQFVYMRMAMTIAEHEPREERMEHVKNIYWLLSRKKMSAPTPNYVNMGTALRGYASCCLFAVADEGTSLAIGHYIADIMTQSSSGIGMNVMCRSIGDPVRGGTIVHQGKLPYYAVNGKAVLANLQNGRGGALNTFYTCYDSEAGVIARLRNIKSTGAKLNRDQHYTFLLNRFFVKKVAAKAQVFTFNVFTAPDLHKAFYGGDEAKFEKLYNKYEADPTFVKNYVDARELLLTVLTEAYETGTAYWMNIDEVNRNTPFLETIYSSNLCVEICEPTKPYTDMRDLFIEEDHQRGEIATCNLGAIPVDNIESDEEYELAAYYSLKMIDFTINHAEYAFPHLGYTAKQRMNAAVGIMGMATHLARLQMNWESDAAKHEAHFVHERHAYHLVKASLRLARERGVAPWAHKTKYAKGWMPFDDVNPNVDKIVEGGFQLMYKKKWDLLRAEAIALGGLGHSVLIAHMPGEASSKALGGCNGLYPARRLVINKSDTTTVVQWAAPHGDNPDYWYHSAWDIATKHLTDHYAVGQKFTDQSQSADFYRKKRPGENITSDEMLRDFFYKIKVGMKTGYYQNTETMVPGSEETTSNNDGSRGCASGACDV